MASFFFFNKIKGIALSNPKVAFMLFKKKKEQKKTV